MAGGKGTDRSKAHVLTAAEKQAAMILQLQVDMANQKIAAAVKSGHDLMAQKVRDDLNISIGFYGRLFTALYAAVNASSADYTGILSMKKEPEVGEAIFEIAIGTFTVVFPEIGALKASLKAFKEIGEVATKVKENGELVGKMTNLLTIASAGDPNKGESMRMAAARRFFKDLDAAASMMGAKFAEAIPAITEWQANPEGNIDHKVKHILAKLKIHLAPEGKIDTNLFSDLFLYDMLMDYVKSNVTLNYTNYSMNFPGGDMTHLSPDDHYFDEAGGKYVWVEGLVEEGCKVIYERFGNKSERAESLYRSHRPTISRPGDLVTKWGAGFYRNGVKQNLQDGSWVSPRW